MEFNNFKDIVALAEKENFTVTSTNSGKHNVGSKHYLGLAIDVRTRDKTAFKCDQFIKLCREKGLVVRDERRKPPGQKVWSGAHLHIEISGVKIMPMLKSGDSGNAVKELQKALGINIDGVFGEKTVKAVMTFQRENNLREDGIVGDATRKALGV